MQEAKTVSDLFYHPNPKLQLEIVDDITTTGGNGLLLVLDGFDEAPSSKRTMDSIFTSETCNLLSKHADLLQHLEGLDLSDNYGIGSGGAVNLVTSLTRFSTIRELNLYGTDIGFEDCKTLSELLASSRYIKVLNWGEPERAPH